MKAAPEGYLLIDRVPKTCTHCKFFRSWGWDAYGCDVKPAHKHGWDMPSKKRQVWCPIKLIRKETDEEQSRSNAPEG